MVIRFTLSLYIRVWLYSICFTRRRLPFVTLHHVKVKGSLMSLGKSLKHAIACNVVNNRAVRVANRRSFHLIPVECIPLLTVIRLFWMLQRYAIPFCLGSRCFSIQTCATSNMIYVLTCPCGQFDYLAYTNRSLANTLIGKLSETEIHLFCSLFVTKPSSGRTSSGSKVSYGNIDGRSSITVWTFSALSNSFTSIPRLQS